MQAGEFTEGMFADRSDESVLKSRSPYALPFRTTFHGVISSDISREYEDPAAFALGLTSPVWRTAAFSIDVALFETLTMLVSAADGGSKIEISADDASILDNLISVAEVAAKSALRSADGPRVVRLEHPRFLHHFRPLGIWVGSIAGALVASYFIYLLGWTG